MHKSKDNNDERWKKESILPLTTYHITMVNHKLIRVFTFLSSSLVFLPLPFPPLPSPSFSPFACLCFKLVYLFLVHYVGAAIGGFTQTTPISLTAPLISSTPLCCPPSTIGFVLVPPTVFHWPYSFPTPTSVSGKYVINLSFGCRHPPSMLIFFEFLVFLLLFSLYFSVSIGFSLVICPSFYISCCFVACSKALFSC
jgi:hypothetical protein